MFLADALRKAIGGKGKNESKFTGRGHVLGNRNENASDSPKLQTYKIFDIIFTEDKMGMSIQEYPHRLPIDNLTGYFHKRAVVLAVDPSSQAFKQGI